MSIFALCARPWKTRKAHNKTFTMRDGDILGAAVDLYEKEPEVHPGLSSVTDFMGLARRLGSGVREARMRVPHTKVGNVLGILDSKISCNLPYVEVEL